ncbi:MAG: hypothetical protein WDN46_24115 [Methylocella sp.]
MLDEFSKYAVIAQAIVASIALLFILFQIWSQRHENRKWKTLDICAQYEFNENVNTAATTVRTAFAKEIPNPDDCKNATIVLNYLDGIAIGIRQGLYIETLARDHLKEIVSFYVSKILNDSFCTDLRLDKRHFYRVIEMDKKWLASEPFYSSKWFRFWKWW